jgi:hypothetical protein
MASIRAVLGGMCAAVVLLGIVDAPVVGAPLIDSATVGASFDAKATVRLLADADDDWDALVLGEDTQTDPALGLPPLEAAFTTLSDSLHENVALRQLLGSTLEIRELGPYADLRPEIEGNDLSDGNRSGTQTLADDPRHPDSEVAGSSTALSSEGVTLQVAARSLVNVRGPKARKPPRTASEGVVDAADDIEDDDDDALGLSERLLDSRMLGDALLTIIQRSTYFESGNEFSILGAGQFELDLTSDLQGFSLFEYSTGVTTNVAVDLTGLIPGDPRAKAKERLDILLLAVNFVKTPTGSLLSIITTVFLLVLGMVRVATATRR